MGRAEGRAGVVGREGYRGRRQQQLGTMGNCESKPQRLPEEQDDREKAILFTTYQELTNHNKVKKTDLQLNANKVNIRN